MGGGIPTDQDKDAGELKAQQATFIDVNRNIVRNIDAVGPGLQTVVAKTGAGLQAKIDPTGDGNPRTSVAEQTDFGVIAAANNTKQANGQIARDTFKTNAPNFVEAKSEADAKFFQQVAASSPFICYGVQGSMDAISRMVEKLQGAQPQGFVPGGADVTAKSNGLAAAPVSALPGATTPTTVQTATVASAGFPGGDLKAVDTTTVDTRAPIVPSYLKTGGPQPA
ncbi:MAG TPA: hypothetical protein VL625_00340 [Patescibacteria group bacterium]|nr:hypothetical protein [Patescibacteria group bacterium]